MVALEGPRARDDDFGFKDAWKGTAISTEGQETVQKTELSARKKVAILMIVLGQETAAEVMKYLADR
jgi:hypothetical protein